MACTSIDAVLVRLEVKLKQKYCFNVKKQKQIVIIIINIWQITSNGKIFRENSIEWIKK